MAQNDIELTALERAFYRALMEIRGIDAQAIESLSGIKVESLLRRRSIADEELALLDASITVITDIRGGVHRASGSTPQGVSEVTTLLRRARDGAA